VALASTIIVLVTHCVVVVVVSNSTSDEPDGVGVTVSNIVVVEFPDEMVVVTSTYVITVPEMVSIEGSALVGVGESSTGEVKTAASVSVTALEGSAEEVTIAVADEFDV
jgi:hypothetical protein